MMRAWLASIVLASASAVRVCGADVWEVLGDVQEVRPGAPEIVRLRLANGGTIDVPLDSLTAASQAAVRRAAPPPSKAERSAERQDGLVTVMGPFGRPVRVDVGESIRDIEADAIQCRTARAAADVYRLALACPSLSPEQRTAAETRLREWSDRADKGMVRLGDRWVLPADALAAAAEADRIVGHALELMRVGNAELAEDELRNAARIDPESGRAGFVAGLAYAVVGKNYAKAVEHFVDAVWREPDNASMLADLGVLELLTRRYGAAAEHFGAAVECAEDPLPVADDVAWAVKLAGAAKVNPSLGKYRMPERTVEELNGLYRTLSQGLKLKPTDVTEEPRFLGPDGAVCTATTLPELASLFETAMPSHSARHALGFVVAAGRVVCPRAVLLEPDGSMLDTVWISLPTDRIQRVSATVVAAPDEGDLALLACEGLSVDPLPLADAPSSASDILAVGRASASWLDVRLQAVAGRILTSESDSSAGGRFIHSGLVPGNVAGGPIVDETGRVVGMVGVTPRTGGSRITAGFGIPVARIRESLEKSRPDSHSGAPGAASGAGDGSARALAATVVVSSARQEPQPKATDAQPPP